MILQIIYDNQLYKDVLCMKHEYENFIKSLNVCRIEYVIVFDRVIEGLNNIRINVNDVSTVQEYFY